MPGKKVTKTPLSPAQLAARRANAQKSTGPKDTSKSKFNNLIHGMRARTPVLPGEDSTRYERRLNALIQRHDPQDDASLFEVEWAAKASWKMERGETVETALATKAINDALQGNGNQQADEVDQLVAELAAEPASTLRQLRRTPAGCLWCLAQYDIFQNHLATHLGLLGTQRVRALHLVGKRMTDVLAGDPLAIRWFSTLIGAAFGNQGDTIDIITRSLGTKPPEGMSRSEFEIHVQDLAARVPDQAEGCTRLEAYIAESIAALQEHLTFVQEIQQNNRAITVRTARIDLGADGKQLLKYQTTQERSYSAALRRLDAGQNASSPGPGRPPKKSTPPVAIAAIKAPATTDSEVMAATTTAAAAAAATSEPETTTEPTIETPGGNFTTEAKTCPNTVIDNELPPGTTRDGLRLSTDLDESDLDASDAEFLRQLELERQLYAAYCGRAASGAGVAGSVDLADGGELAPAAPGDDPAEMSPRPPPLGMSGGGGTGPQ